MIKNPDNFVGAFARAGANMLSVHPEATYHLDRTINHIRQVGCQAGVVLNPATPLAMIEEVIADVDYVLLMSVNPGFSGQKFITSSLDKLRRLRDLILMKSSPARIEIDGGVGPGNAGEVVAAGAEILVAGSAIFGAENPGEALKDLLRVAESSGRVTA
jgi:ribulose-phosphate 3-epimerase